VAHNNLGKVYFQERRFYAAAKHFDRAARLLPHHSEPRNNLGLVLEEAGRLDEAVMAYERALKRQPDHPEVIGNLARARVRRGDTGNEVLRLLADLAFLDERPLWRKWARLTAIKLQPDERADDGWIAPASLDATPTTE
jgi:cytochrome c-type biogenesis protein CcmH/NrfG